MTLPPGHQQTFLSPLSLAQCKITSAFLEKGCGCKRNQGKPCYTLFSRDHYESVQMQCSELTRNELDLVLLGQALLSSDPDTAASNQRKRSNMAFYHGGARICRITFQKLHGIGTMISEHAHVLTCTHAHMHTQSYHTN